MKKALILAIIAIFICSSVWAGKTIMNAPGGKRTSAQLTNTMAFPLDSGTSDYWTDLAEHYAWVKAQMDVLYASKPWYDGAATQGSIIKFYGPTVANGGHGTWTALQGADYDGLEGTGLTWRLPITAYPSAGTTKLLNVDQYGQMGQVDPATFAAASHNQAYTTLTGVMGTSKYLGTNASGTYGIFDLPSGFSGSYADLSNIPSTFAPAAHNHAGSEITSGTVGAAYLPVVGSATGGIVPTTNGVTDGYVIAKQPNGSAAWVAPGGGFTNLTDFDTQTAWRIFYSDGSGDVTELALGSDGEYLKSNGASSAPSWATPSGAAHDAITLSTDLGNNLLGLSTQQITLDNQNANIVFAGPSTGSAAAPSFRSLVAADIPSLTATYAVIAGTPSTTFQLDNDASGPLIKWDSGNTRLVLRNSADSAYYDLVLKNLYVENINSTKADGEYYANFDNTVDITFPLSPGHRWSKTTTGTSVDYFYDGTAARKVLNSGSPVADFPTLNQNTTGTSGGLTAQYIDWNSSSGGTSIANKPTLPTFPSGTIVGTSDTQTLSAKTLTAPKETVVAGGTCSTSYAPDLAAGSIFSLTLNGACEISNPSNLAAGQSFVIRLTQSSTTAPTWGANFKWPAGTAPTWSTSATKYDLVSCVSVDGTTLSCGGLIDVR